MLKSPLFKFTHTHCTTSAVKLSHLISPTIYKYFFFYKYLVFCFTCSFYSYLFLYHPLKQPRFCPSIHIPYHHCHIISHCKPILFPFNCRAQVCSFVIFIQWKCPTNSSFKTAHCFLNRVTLCIFIITASPIWKDNMLTGTPSGSSLISSISDYHKSLLL